ncbi:MAG TPA: hypothetical protein VFT22_06840 [Kofleriaceae bacterium]|nr:hypothetical protein [Kofleriaceae bacterium]
MGGVAATVLGAAGFPAGRVLIIPDLAFAPVIGLVMYRGLAARWPGRVIAAILAIVHLLIAPLQDLRAIGKLELRARATAAIAAQIAARAAPAGRVFIVAASDPMVFLYPRGLLADLAPGAVYCWSTLSAARAGHRITRTGERSLAIEPIERPLLDGSFDRLFRAPDRSFAVGDRFEQCGATIRVAAVRDGRPSRLEVELRRAFRDPKLVLLVWRDGALVPFEPPAPGETVEIPWSPGPSGVL